jgi:hypothetical protein
VLGGRLLEVYRGGSIATVLLMRLVMHRLTGANSVT